MNMKKLATLLVSSTLCVALLAGCGGDTKSDKGGAGKEKVLRVAAETTYPPFEFADGKDYKGFDVDLSYAIGKELGYKVEFVSMGFDALIPALESKQIDAIASGMVITKERLEKINFSDPYYDINLVMVVKNDNTTVTKEEDISGKKVAAQIGTTGAFLAEKKPNTTVKQFDTIPPMLQDLSQGAVEIVMLDEPIAKYYIQISGMKDLKIVPVALQKHELGIGLRKADTQLLADVNKALKKLKENGEMKKLEDKWFGNIK